MRRQHLAVTCYRPYSQGGRLKRGADVFHVEVFSFLTDEQLKNLDGDQATFQGKTTIYVSTSASVGPQPGDI